MKVNIKKMDKRHTGNQYFNYLATIPRHIRVGLKPRYQHVMDFVELRMWCWENFGASCEYSEYALLTDDNIDCNPRWCWMTNGHHIDSRILILNQADVNWLTLRWA